MRAARSGIGSQTFQQRVPGGIVGAARSDEIQSRVFIAGAKTDLAERAVAVVLAFAAYEGGRADARREEGHERRLQHVRAARQRGFGIKANALLREPVDETEITPVEGANHVTLARRRCSRSIDGIFHPPSIPDGMTWREDSFDAPPQWRPFRVWPALRRPSRHSRSGARG